jgi:diguanylate cyclase (GGDEF)-like protein/PAS domain S-box-containing protein
MGDEQKTISQLTEEINGLRKSIARLQQESRLPAVLTSIEDSVFFIDRNGIFKYFFGEGCGFDRTTKPEHLIKKKFKDALPQELALQIEGAIDRVEATGHSHDFDYKLSCNSTEEWYNAKVSPFRDEKGNLDGITAVVRNITERKRMEENNRHHALHDPLTNLPNRELFNDRFNNAMAQAQRKNHKVALMMIDIDEFRYINDTYGHDAGDMVLVEVGRRMTSILRKSDTVARIGGDEFLLLIPEIRNGDEAAFVASKILRMFKEPFVINNDTINVTLSIGIAIYPDDVETIDALMKMADIAMYRVKKKGKNSFARFSP